VRRAAAFDLDNAGSINAARMLMMAITTSNSIKVKATQCRLCIRTGNIRQLE
jgi:hypothetical protein